MKDQTEDRGLDPEWHTGPPWKASVSHYQGDRVEYDIWTVTSDRGDPSDEYDVLESLTESQARLIATAPALVAEVERLRKIKSAARMLVDDAGTQLNSFVTVDRDLFDALCDALDATEGGDAVSEPARPDPELLWDFLRHSHVQDEAFGFLERLKGTEFEAQAAGLGYLCKRVAVKARQRLRKHVEALGYPDLESGCRAMFEPPAEHLSPR